MTRKFRCLALGSVVLLGGCAVNDSHVALAAKQRLLGMSAVALETCMGVPDGKSTFGGTQIFTYAATSTSSTSLSIPLIGGIGNSYGGYCHVILRLDHGVVDSVRYTGETSAFVDPDAYCAPIVRGCMDFKGMPATPAPAATAQAGGGAAREPETPDAKT